MKILCLLSAVLIASAAAFAPQNAARSAGVAMKAAKKDEEVVNFKKPEFVASVSEKTGLSKAESEAALAAVLETIQEVGGFCLFLSIGFSDTIVDARQFGWVQEMNGHNKIFW